MPYEKHKYINTPPDDTRIWRYLSLDKFLFLITKSQLYFTRADKFDDKWEGALPIPNSEYLQKEMIYNVEDINMIESGQEYLKDIKDAKITMFINCWHMNNHESSAMWKLYGGQGTSIAITSTIEKLKESLEWDYPFFISEVEYLDYDIESKRTMNLLNTFCMKRISYSHEKEVRILFNICDYYSYNDIIKKDIPVPGIPIPFKRHNLIESVYLSPDSPDWLLETVKDITEKYFGKELDIKKSSLNDPYIY